MKPAVRRTLRIFLKVLIGLLLFVVACAIIFVVRISRKPELDAETRRKLGGSYIHLSLGVTHYEWNRVSDDAPLVVLYQGVTVPMMVYDKVVPALNDAGFSTLRFDWWGRGLSDRPMVTYTTALYARQGMELLDALHIDGATHAVGISLGGAVVARIAQERPSRIASIVLIGPAVAFSAQQASDQKWNFIKERAKVFKKNPPLDRNRPLTDPEAFKPHIAKQLAYRGMEWAFLSIGINENQFDYLTQYRRLAAQPPVPMAFIWGENDNHFPLSDGRRLARLFPHAEFHVIPGGGHTPHYGQSELTNPVLIRFLKNVSGNAAQ